MIKKSDILPAIQPTVAAPNPEFTCYIGSKLEPEKDKIRLRIKNYLELDNVSILAGAGTSYHIGAPLVRNIPSEIHDKISKNVEIKDFYLSELSSISNGKPGSSSSVSLEDFLNFIQAERYIASSKGVEIDKYGKLIRSIQAELFKLCNTESAHLNSEYETDKNLADNKYHYHEKLVKKLLQRPINLRRINLFTTNYDLAFDYAFDNSGVQNINGFCGFHKRCFRPESFDYDFYYPGQTTTGKVHRAEKVIRYFKLHGSLSWAFKEPDIKNLYGIEEISLNQYKPDNPVNELVIYPCATKKSFTLDLPYSELFRFFSCTIKVSQSALFCLGYSFNDEHVNDIIFQALSIPSFTLFIVDFKGISNPIVNQLKSLDDPRIIIIEGEFGKFTKFVSDILPDLYEEKDEIQVARTINEIKGISKRPDAEPLNG